MSTTQEDGSAACLFEPAVVQRLRSVPGRTAGREGVNAGFVSPFVPPVPPFEIRVQPYREAVHLEVVGELDLASAPALEAQVQDMVARGFAHVVIDLREATFIDCAALSVLLAADADARRRGWRLSLFQGPEAVRRLFALTGSLDVLPFEPAVRPPRPELELGVGRPGGLR